MELLERLRLPLTRFLFTALVILILGFGFLVNWAFLLLNPSPVAFALGQLSRADFLAANLAPYPATQFANTCLPANARIYAISDGRGYYHTRAFLADAGRDHWGHILFNEQTPERVAARLRADGVTHVWVSEEDWAFERNFVDVNNRVARESAAFEEFRARFLGQVYRDARGFVIYALK